jgi:hypothetical protein
MSALRCLGQDYCGLILGSSNTVKSGGAEFLDLRVSHARRTESLETMCTGPGTFNSANKMCY